MAFKQHPQSFFGYNSSKRGLYFGFIPHKLVYTRAWQFLRPYKEPLMNESKAPIGHRKSFSTTPSETIRILIAEDTTLVRYGLSKSLQQIKHFAIVGEACNGKQALDMALIFEPDVILMDYNMPVMDGLQATIEIKKHLPTCKIIMITEAETTEKALDALKKGVDGYCLKHTTIETLSHIIQMVPQGICVIDSHFIAQLRQAIPQHMTSPKTNTNTIHLTNREKEVLALIVAGKSNKEIAVILQMTFHTAKAHVCRIIQKLGVED